MRPGLAVEAGAEPFPGYCLRKLLGRGGFAEVWEATSPDGPVALKFMHVDDPRAAAHEVRAIQSMKRLHHNNLIRMYREWSVPGYVVFSMELADGSLHDLLQAFFEEYGTAISPDVLCGYLSQAASAIDYLNARRVQEDGKRLGFVHGDIKPSNMLLMGDTLKLADFGLASPMMCSRAHRLPVGTIDFAAPEVFDGWMTDRSDQYSLAVSYVLLRTGRMPFPDPPTRFSERYVRPAPDLRLVPDVERPILMKALSPVPQDRWPSCLAFIEAIQQLYPGISGSGGSSSSHF